MRRRSGDVSLRRLDFGWCIAACYLATGDLKEEKPPLEATDEWSSLFIYFFQIFFYFICLLFCGVLSGLRALGPKRGRSRFGKGSRDDGEQGSKEGGSTQIKSEDNTTKVNPYVQVNTEGGVGDVEPGLIHEKQASGKIIEVGQLVTEDVLFQQHVANKDQTGGAISVSLNTVDLVVFYSTISDSIRVENSLGDVGPDSVGTGYSVVVDQRSTRADAKEISSPKRRKWKHLARAKAGESGMYKGSVVADNRLIMFKDEGISDCKRSRSGCDESNGKAERNMRAN
ncbi:hypothetical protein ACOSQ4_007170 [Xanthoceras sorbifolium]